MNPFPNFPKKREPLPIAYSEIYDQHYKSNRDGDSAASGLAQKLESWMHHKVAEDIKNSSKDKYETLDIGAGTLNHYPYEKETQQAYDVVEPYASLYENSAWKSEVRHFFDSMDDVKKKNQYDRILSIAAFEHIEDLPKVVAQSAVSLKGDGRLRVAIPSEGSLLWKMGWRLTTGIEFYLKHKLDYGVLMRYEHVNSYPEIQKVLRHFFGNVKVSSLGFGASFSFYQFLECSHPQKDLSLEFLSNYRS